MSSTCTSGRHGVPSLWDKDLAGGVRKPNYDCTWGLCLSHRQLLELAPGEYEVVIHSTLEPGHLSYAELVIDGEGEGLVSTYVCHLSLANDNLSGNVVATMLAQELLERGLRHTCRLLFAPGTIGPLSWLQ
jgi:aminopeptidase-like protein